MGGVSKVKARCYKDEGVNEEKELLEIKNMPKVVKINRKVGMQNKKKIFQNIKQIT